MCTWLPRPLPVAADEQNLRRATAVQRGKRGQMLTSSIAGVSSKMIRSTG